MSRKIALSLPRPSALMALMAGAALVAALASPSAHALEVQGVKFDDNVKVAGQPLVLSGAGLRTKVIKLYVLGVYFAKKETTQAAVLGAQGPRRFQIVMLRELNGEDFGNAFLAGINKNLDKEEKAKLFGPLAKLGEAFERIGGLKKGDVVVGDWVPGQGTVLTLNGKPVTENITDPLFYTAVLRIWYGDKPAEVSLKKSLLGEELNF